MTDSNTQRVKFEKKYCPKCYAQFEQIDVCPEDGATLIGQDNNPMIGKTFAERYVIQSVIGMGGMSIVSQGAAQAHGPCCSDQDAA